MNAAGEEWEPGASREQGMRAGPASVLFSPIFFTTGQANGEGAIGMPNSDDQENLERARQDARAGKSPSTQVGAFVREEIDHLRVGKHGKAGLRTTARKATRTRQRHR